MISKNDRNLIGKGSDINLAAQVVALDKRLDVELGLDTREVSKENSCEFQYHGLAVEALQTSYLDYLQIFEKIGKTANMIDVGAGHCRGTLLAEKLGYKCTSIEIVKDRIVAAKKCAKNKEHIIQADITDTDFKLPIADYYFLYLPHGKVLYQTLKKIKEISQNKKVSLIVIESHGNVIDYLKIQKNWLILKDAKLQTSTTRHDPAIYFFDSKIGKSSIIEEHWSWNLDRDLELLVKDSEKSWTLDAYQSVIWVSEAKVMLETFSPCRMLEIEKVESTRKISEQSEDYQKLRHARNIKKPTKYGYILKIIIFPEKKVEWINSKFTDWDDSLKILDETYMN